jgi:uncharacterized protein
MRSARANEVRNLCCVFEKTADTHRMRWMNSPSAIARVMPRANTLCLFLAFAGIAIALLQASHGFFPGDRVGAYLGRLFGTSVAIVLLVLGSRWLLMRDGLAPERLALGFNATHARAFAIGTAIAVGHIFVLLVALYLVAPFQLGAGPLAASEVSFAAISYLTGNFVEELLFRGYLLIALSRWLGATRALWMLAVLFGLFHFPGLGPEAMGKMMLTTGAMHFVYAYAFLATRSLWAAVALLAVGNTLLHKVVGVGEPALLSTRFETAPPNAVDAPLAWTSCAPAASPMRSSGWSKLQRMKGCLSAQSSWPRMTIECLAS